MRYTKKRPEETWEIIEQEIKEGKLPPWYEAESEDK